MFFVGYNKEADPWYHIGNALGLGAGLLAFNRDSRETYKQDNYLEAEKDINRGKGLLTSLNAFKGLQSFDDTTKSKIKGLLGNTRYANMDIDTPEKLGYLTDNIVKWADGAMKYKQAQEGRRVNKDFVDYSTYKEQFL